MGMSSLVKNMKARLFGKSGGAGAPQAPAGYNAPINIPVTVTVKANASTSQGIPAEFIVDPKVGSVKEYQLTPSEAWVIDDVYVLGAQGVDGTLVIKKNGVDIIKVTNVNALDVTKPQRPRPLASAPIRFFPGEKIGFEFIPATSPASDTTVTIYVSGTKRFVPPTP